MTPEQRIKRQILIDFFKGEPEYGSKNLSTAEDIDKVWSEVCYDEEYEDVLEDYVRSFRDSGEESGIPDRYCGWHYECLEVARVLDDGTAVGWTYWYGGGKHSEPEAVDWMDSAYEVEVKQETRVVNVYTKKA